jgi:hypothetical protein
MRYKLIIAEGSYEANSLWSLFWEIMKHRYFHWRRGDGWRD